MKKHSDRQHASFAPSAAHRWMNCPGSFNLSKKAPPQFESKYAIEGTQAHECLEFIVKRYSNLHKVKTEAVKKWDEEKVEHAITAAKIIFDLRPSPSAKLSTETKVKLEHISKNLYGSLDYSWVEDFGSLVVIDYKYGAGVPVSPVENHQLLTYAVGVAKKHNYEFDSVKLVIIQPRVEGVQSGWVTTVKRLQQFERELKDAIRAAKQPDARLNNGEWCRWCPALTICPAVSKNQMVKADIVFDVDTGIEAVPDPKGVTVDKLPAILDACEVLELWIKGVREHAFNLADNGKKIKGWKLEPKRAQRVWLPKAEALAKRTFGSMAFKTEMLSPAQLEKSVGKEGAKSFIEKNTAQVSSGFNLVREDGKPEVFDLDTKPGKA